MLYSIVWLTLVSLVQAGPTLVRIPETVAASSVVQRVAPVYPAPGEMNVEGEVVLEIEVNREGAVVNVRTIAGHPLLVQSAQTALRQWRFDPAMLKGEARVVTTVRVRVAPERARLTCGPFESVRLFKTPPDSEQIGVLECGEEVVILGRTMSAVEIQTGQERGWANSLHIAAPPQSAESSSASAGLGQARLECSQRPTLNIFDSPGATTIGRLSCGETVSILARDDPYAKIRTASGVEGWVIFESLTPVTNQ
jgi:TonB family protein